MHQKNELYSVLEDWHKTIFPQLNLRNINVDNNLTHEDIPLHDIAKTKVNDGHKGLYGWKHIIQQTKVILEDLIQDVVIPNMQLVYYPPNGYMNWHTNSNNPSTRIYLVRSTDTPESKMKFKDKVIEDKPFWSFNIFEVGKNTWHCIDAKTERLSLGFHYKGNQSISDIEQKLNQGVENGG